MEKKQTEQQLFVQLGVGTRFFNNAMARLGSCVQSSDESAFVCAKGHTVDDLSAHAGCGVIIHEKKKHLTEQGMMIFLQCLLDVSFLQMCFLVEAYCCYNKVVKGYPKNAFDEAVRKKSASNAVWSLVRKGLVHRKANGLYVLDKKISEKIARYDFCARLVHDWFVRELMVRA